MRAVAALPVAAYQHQLVSAEEIGHLARVDARCGAAVQLNIHRHIGHHGRADFGIEGRDRRLDVFVGADVDGLAAHLARQAVQQARVDVEADAEREGPRMHLVLLGGVGGDAALLRLARRGLAVGEKDHVVGPRGIVEHAQTGAQGAVDVGAAAGVDAVHPLGGGAQGLRVGPLQLGTEGLHFGIVRHDVECVARLQLAHQELERRLGLADLLAAHAAGAVAQEDHGLGDVSSAAGAGVGSGQQDEVSVFVVVGPVADHVQADRRGVGGVEQAHVVGPGHIVEA